MKHNWPVFTLILLGLIACSGLDTRKIATTIQADIVKKGGTSLKSVTCPKGIQPEAAKTFECVGEMDNGYTFTIPVKQQDAKGTVVWDVPHAKGLLNLSKLETTMQTTLATELKTTTTPSVKCGDGYRAVKPGDGFDCQLVYQRPVTPKSKQAAAGAKTTGAKTSNQAARSPQPITQTEKITVSTSPEGDVSWQRILPTTTKPKTAKTPQPEKTASQTAPIPAKVNSAVPKNTKRE